MIPDQVLLSAFLGSTPDHVYFKDVSSRFVWVSASLARSLGRSVEAVIGRTDFDFFDQARAQSYREIELQILRTAQAVVDRVVEHTWPDGHVTWSLNVAMPIRNNRGEIVGIWGTNKDITASKRLQLALDARTQELQAANSLLARMNQELAAETRRANEMTQRAVAQTHAKSEFLAVVSHDVRNPFQSIMGCVELLTDTPLDPMQRDYVETIQDAARSTLTLVNDLLDVSKAEAGRLELERTELHLAETLEGVARLLSIQAHAKGLEFTVDVDPQVPELIWGDPARIRQVLVNLAANAVKFTESGEVTVEVRVAENSPQGVTLRFAVRDTGIGISANGLEQLWQPYSQAERRFGGTGLGLHIVQRIVELMGGATGVESREGCGSTFWFTAVFEVVTPQRCKASAPAMKGRVLVVDDNATQRRVLARQLERQGLQAITAGSAEEALVLLHEAHTASQSIAVALLDHQMPGCDGAELGRRINADPRLSSIRLVLLTSSRQMHEHEIFAVLGIAACLAKPVTQRDLIDCLQLVLAGSVDDWHTQTSPVITQNLLRAHRGRDARHILVADDIPAGRKVVCRTLERLGYRASGVGTGHEAVAAWQAGQYDLILMDWEMPQLNGCDATRIIRSRELPGQHIPVVALTGRTMPGAELECKAAGMDAHLAKPVDREGLEACLARFLSESIESGEYPRLLAGAADNDGVPVDMTALRLLADDDEFLRELVADFILQGSAAIPELDDALLTGDALRLARTAHALKTAAGALKASTLYRSVAQLESAARGGVADQYAVLTAQVRQNVTDTMEYLRAWAA